MKPEVPDVNSWNSVLIMGCSAVWIGYLFNLSTFTFLTAKSSKKAWCNQNYPLVKMKLDIGSYIN